MIQFRHKYADMSKGVNASKHGATVQACDAADAALSVCRVNMQASYQQQGLTMHMHSIGSHCCQQSLEYPQLNAIIWNVITAAQKLHGLGLHACATLQLHLRPTSQAA